MHTITNTEGENENIVHTLNEKAKQVFFPILYVYVLTFFC